jgi:2-desacetyl-2-hydroxyethyl bacteriochlorophyllide A dehydrogenase
MDRRDILPVNHGPHDQCIRDEPVKGAVLARPGRLEVMELPVPDCGPRDVLVRVCGVGICGSDLSMYRGHWSFPRPFVIGHEGFGRIFAVGSDVDGRSPGQVVAVEPNIVCGECELCRGGRSSVCVRKRSLGVGSDGLCAEFARVPAEFTWPLPDAIRAEDAVCVEPLAVGIAAVRDGDPKPGERTTVFGAGSQGLLLTLALAERGCFPHVIDPQEARLDLARECGAASVATAAGAELGATDCAFETSGAPGAVEAAIEMARAGGRVILIGLSDRPARLDTAGVVRKRLQVRGSIIYEHPADFAATVRLVADGRIRPGRVVTRAFSLDEVDEALRAAPQVVGKSWISLGSRPGTQEVIVR